MELLIGEELFHGLIVESTIIGQDSLDIRPVYRVSIGLKDILDV
jgi:hypothetical protein